MALLDYFRRRREAESAIQPQMLDAMQGGEPAETEPASAASGESIANAIHQANQMGSFSFHDSVKQAFAFEKAWATGGQIGGYDMGQLQALQSSVLDVMKQHGIDPMRPDPSKFMDPAVQRDIEAAVQQHGFGAPGQAGTP